MGWDYCYEDTEIADVVTRLVRSVSWKDSAGEAHSRTTFAHSLRGRTLWTVEDIRQGEKTERVIGCHLLRKSRSEGCWGYKAMCEGMGPYHYDCPLRYLDLVPQPTGGYGGWREKVHAWHAKRRATRSAARLRSRAIG